MRTQSMRPAVVCLIACLNDFSVLAAVVIAVIGVAVVVLISFEITLISAFAIVAFVVVPTAILLIVSPLG